MPIIPGERYKIQAAVKTLDVLFLFREPPHAFTLAELSRRVPFSKNQVYRCVQTLESYGLLRMDSSGKYCLTGALYPLACAAEAEASLVKIAQPSLDRLARETGFAVHLVAYLDDMAVVLDRRDSRSALSFHTKIGTRTHLHAGAAPKAIFAFLPPDDQERLLKKLPTWPALTPRTITDPAVMRRELALIRQRGYAVGDEDYEVGGRAVGAPLFNPHGQVVGSLSCGGAALQLPLEELPHLAELVKEEAAVISRQIIQGTF
ncbi:MAG: IclR family transcriptional regulator [Clostridiales bacterium]|nr:IclR family transcriptional regulator [Clostridiales bacterium]